MKVSNALDKSVKQAVKLLPLSKAYLIFFCRTKMLCAVSFSKSTLTWEKYILKMLIKLIIY